MRAMKHTIPKRVLLIGLAGMLLSLSACSKSVLYDEQTVGLEAYAQRQVPLELYVEEEIKLGEYEPVSGVYTGAYVQKDENITGDLLAYERMLGQVQTFKVFEYNLEENLPAQELLRCMAQKKVPYIKIVLDNNYDLTPLYHLVYDLKSAYGMPVFIELYPLTTRNYAPSEYKKIYQRAYEIVHKYVKNAIVVWSTDESRVSDMPLYYPGDKYIDWAGINIYIPRYKQGERYSYEGTKQLDFWYKNFQHTKPMLISSLAISHFSRVDHVYTIHETQDQLTLFYKEVLENYPRLRGILYMNVDMNAISNNNKEDYRLTTQPALINTMKALTLPLACENTLQIPQKDKVPCYMKYSIIGTYFEDKLYISEEYMGTCFPKVNLKKVAKKQDLQGEVYYALDELSKYTACYYKS